jgi:hypothetical protein
MLYNGLVANKLIGRKSLSLALFLLLVLASPLAARGSSALVLEPGALTTSSQTGTVDDGGGPFSVTLSLTISGSNLVAEAQADTGAAGWADAVTLSVDQAFLFQFSGILKPDSAYTTSDHYLVLHSESTWGGPVALCAREGGVNPWLGGATHSGYEELSLVDYGTTFDCGGALGSLGITLNTAVSGDVKYTIPVTDPRIDTDGDSQVRIFSTDPFGNTDISWNVKYVTPASSGTTSFNGQPVSFSTTGGVLQGLTALSDLSVPQTGRPPGLNMPYGLFSFNIVVPSKGASASVTITFPSTLPAGMQWWKVHGGVWQQLPSSQVSQSGSQLTIKLTDGASPDDDDGLANGVIVEPGGTGFGPAQAVGGEIVPMNVAGLVAPWIALIVAVAVVAAGVSVFARRLVTKRS